MASNDEQKIYQRGYTRGYSTGQKNISKYIERAARLRAVLQQIADMDPNGQRADDLGRAARVARDALAAHDGVMGTDGGDLQAAFLAGAACGVANPKASVDDMKQMAEFYAGGVLASSVSGGPINDRHQQSPLGAAERNADQGCEDVVLAGAKRRTGQQDEGASLLRDIRNLVQSAGSNTLDSSEDLAASGVAPSAPAQQFRQCTLCSGRGFYGSPGKRCEWCDGEGNVPVPHVSGVMGTDGALLLNLAQRLRWARQQVKRAQADGWPAPALYEAKGAELEAHNSFQAAKQLASGVMGTDGPSLLDALKAARQALYEGSFPLGWNIDRVDEVIAARGVKEVDRG